MEFLVVVVLLLLVSGLPGAFVGGRRGWDGAAVGWVGGVFGAVAMVLLCNRLERVLPHHIHDDVLGPSRVVDFPPEPVWQGIKLACIALASVGAGWLVSRDGPGQREARRYNAELQAKADLPRRKRYRKG